MEAKKRFKHDCNKCKYLGTYKEYDLYFCAKGIETVIARYGSLGWENLSGLVFATSGSIESLYEAKNRAIKKGFLKESTEHPYDLSQKGKLYDALKKRNDELVGALEVTLKALIDICTQIPNGETLANYNFDLSEIAQNKAEQALKNNSND